MTTVAKFGLALFLSTSAALAGEVADCQLVPGWQQEGASRVFTADNLFEYVDGDAEGYLIYGFVRMHNLTCKSGEDTLVVDVSEMADAEGAYGLFTARLNPGQPVSPLGMGGQVQPQRAAFCKGRYYVELAGAPDKDHSAALQAFAKAIAARITGRATPPDALTQFPTDNLISIRPVPESVLGLRALKRGYVAQYKEGQAFIVTEESPDAAATVLSQLRVRFAETTPAEVADEAFSATDRYLGGLCFFRKGRTLAGYANLPESSKACSLAKILAARLH